MRRKATGWAAAALFVVGSGAVVVDPDSDTSTQLEAAAEQTVTTTTTAPAPLIEPGDMTPIETAPASTLAPSTTAKPRRAATATTTTTTAAPTGPAPLTKRPWPYPTRNNPSVQFAPDPDRTEWSFAANGITLNLKLDQQNAPAGPELTFTYEATSDLPCCAVEMLYGGGLDWQHGLLPCRPTQPGTATVPAPITYNGEGIWEFQATAIAGPCEGPLVHMTVYGWVYVTRGEATPQGPSKPQLELTWHDDDGLAVSIDAKGWDEDGYLDHFTVDWGDGTPVQTQPGDGMGCIQLTSGWPNTSHAFLVHLPHEYSTGVQHTVTVTAYSRGCYGNMVQTVTRTLTG